ncbi:MAG: hypothetical protein J6Y39_07825 [Bacteroidaceae bacterium]|nr:hypothetical protein [Bacteroidaceae bacterium]
MRALSIAKFEEGITNEDAAIARKGVIAVSDGAGGGGVFAEFWSRYLVEHLPDTPICNYKAFDKWVEKIWEPFYNNSEKKAKEIGGLFLNKFYDEGSYATLVAVWQKGQWISYGDSVVFCYNRKSGELQHSFTSLSDFNNPPYLVNCKDPLNSNGFRCGKFKVSKDCVLFAASDTLAHYILMMYEVAKKKRFADELQKAIDANTKNSNYIKAAMAIEKIDFGRDVVRKLLYCERDFLLKNHIKGLKKKKLIGHDDYSLVIM